MAITFPLTFVGEHETLCNRKTVVGTEMTIPGTVDGADTHHRVVVVVVFAVTGVLGLAQAAQAAVVRRLRSDFNHRQQKGALNELPRPVIRIAFLNLYNARRAVDGKIDVSSRFIHLERPRRRRR